MNKLIKEFKRRFSVAAPRLAVRPHLPWYLRWALAVPVLLLTAWLVWWAYGSGMELAGFFRAKTEDELSSLRHEATTLREENARLSKQMVVLHRQMQMEQSANTELQEQLKSLNDEKAHLNEDLALYQNLTLSGSRKESLTIQRLKVTHDTLPGEYHCSMLLVQGGQRPRDFRGKLQFVVNGMLNGQKSVLVVPGDKSPERAAYQLDFKYYQRIERTFKLPAGMTFGSLQVRVYQHGSSQPKVKQDADLS